VANAGVRGALLPGQGVRPLTTRRPPMWTRGGRCASPRSHGNSCDARPDAVPGDRCYRRPRPPPSAVSMVGVRSAWPPGRPCGTGAVLPQTMPDASAVAVRFRTPAGHAAASAVARRAAVLVAARRGALTLRATFRGRRSWPDLAHGGCSGRLWWRVVGPVSREAKDRLCPWRRLLLLGELFRCWAWRGALRRCQVGEP
jgi:hypothetical protein